MHQQVLGAEVAMHERDAVPRHLGGAGAQQGGDVLFAALLGDLRSPRVVGVEPQLVEEREIVEPACQVRIAPRRGVYTPQKRAHLVRHVRVNLATQQRFLPRIRPSRRARHANKVPGLVDKEHSWQVAGRQACAKGSHGAALQHGTRGVSQPLIAHTQPRQRCLHDDALATVKEDDPVGNAAAEQAPGRHRIGRGQATIAQVRI